jgi:HD-GYP domain-containing protein (c-di-GMP phosphodiesterase class II)
VKGTEMLQPLNLAPRTFLTIMQHHERMNGTGYPLGLSGEDILLEARILAVADVVEAISSHRPYRPSLGIDHAVDELCQNRGTLYDPGVVDALVRQYSTTRWDTSFFPRVFFHGPALPQREGVGSPKFTEKFLFSEVCATMPSTQGFGFKN